VPVQLTLDKILNIVRAEGIIFTFSYTKDRTYLFLVVELGLLLKLCLSDYIKNKS
jgi:hypothetical protein